MTRKQKLAAWIGGILFAFLVWPRLWAYDKSGTVRVRNERITGEVQALSRGGWYTTDPGWAWRRAHPTPAIQPPPPAPSRPQFLTQQEIDKITVDDTTLDGGGNLTVNIYNDSDKTISNLTLEILVGQSDSKTADVQRAYRLTKSDFDGCTPQSNCTFATSAAYHLQPKQAWDIGKIINATIFY